MRTIALAIALLCLVFSSPSFARTAQTQDTTYYVAIGGSDAGPCSQAAPCASMVGAYNWVQRNIDLSGYSVTITALPTGTSCASSTTPAVYTASNQMLGPLVGQAGPVIFLGCPLQPNMVVVQPVAAPGQQQCCYAFSASSGANFVISGFTLDMTNGNSDTLAIGTLSRVAILDGIVFGFNLQPWNDISNNGLLIVAASYTINKSLINTTWSGPANANVLTLPPGVAANIKPFMGVNGSYMSGNPVAYVTSVNPAANQVTIAAAATNSTSVSGIGINFVGGGQTHIDNGFGGIIYYNTNGTPGLISVTLIGGPFYYSGFYYGDQNSVCNCTAISFINWGWGKRYEMRTNGVFDSNFAGPNYLPGTMPGTTQSGAQYQ